MKLFTILSTHVKTNFAHVYVLFPHRLLAKRFKLAGFINVRAVAGAAVPIGKERLSLHFAKLNKNAP